MAVGKRAKLIASRRPAVARATGETFRKITLYPFLVSDADIMYTVRWCVVTSGSTRFSDKYTRVYTPRAERRMHTRGYTMRADTSVNFSVITGHRSYDERKGLGCVPQYSVEFTGRRPLRLYYRTRARRE